MKIAFELVGETPLLMHADDVEKADELEAWRKDPSNKELSRPGDDRSPAWTWQTYLYSDGKAVVIPSENLMTNLRIAAAQIILKKQKTFKEVSQNGMLVQTEFLDFSYADGRKLMWADVLGMRDETFKTQADRCQKLGFRLFAKRARVGQAKHVRVRARFDTWTVRGVMLVTAPVLTFEKIEQMFEIGGRGGLCDWRPFCKTPGPYGQFTAKLKKVG